MPRADQTTTPLRRPRLPLVAAALLASLPLALSAVKSYVPLSYPIQFGVEECIYDRIAKPSEHLTASVFLLSGDELAAAIVFEGPIAPPDLETKPLGAGLKRYADRYAKEGTKMFVNGKFGDSMVNVKPLRIAEIVNFEEEEEDYRDDYGMDSEERRAFNAHHDREHWRGRPPPPEGWGEEEGEDGDDHEEGPGGADADDENGEIEDDYVRARVRSREAKVRERLRWELDREAEMDDDFVKLQVDQEGGGRKRTEPELKEGKVPERRRIVDKDRRRLLEEDKDEDEGRPAGRGRRLLEEPRELVLVAGEPYQRTVQVTSPGWYRLCVHGKSTDVVVEMELRKSSVYGPVDRRTGHVPYMTEVETHGEIHGLFAEETDEEILAEEGGIKKEDLKATKEQLRILERVYADIIERQLEERRTWNWRTVKNQHLYSHLVLGNLVETVVYMAITGWQVYTIRKWFGGGPALGR